jgi:lysophospholipase L1-like esterase
MDKLERIVKPVKDGWLIVGLTFLLLLFLEGTFHLVFFIRDSRVNASKARVDYRAKADTYSDSSWPQKYYQEFQACVFLRWKPYVYWCRSAFQGNYINIDSDGIRKSWVPTAKHTETNPPLTIFMFGGSTMWGTGARDDFTIPSILTKKLREEGIYAETTNFGETGYVTSQEIIALTLELRNGNIPELVIFYDGVNDTYSAYQQHVAGLPQNEFNRSNEFNQSKPYHIKQFRGIVIQDTIKRVATLRFIRGVLRQLGLLGKSTGGVRPQTNIGNSASDNEFMTHDVIGIYRSNIELVKALAAHYGFQYIFYWQPTIFQKTHLTAYEESERRKQREIQPFFQKTYKHLAEQRNFAKGESYKFHNLSYIFSDVQEPLFVDWIHLGESGNAIIADRMVADVLAIIDGNKRSGQ